MKQKLPKQKYPGQIMVIVLVLMSILSIIALSVTLTSVRDKEEKTQNSQYQSYYAVGENKMLDFQQLIGRKPLATIEDTVGLIGDTGTGETIEGGCTRLDPIDLTTLKRTCTFPQIGASNFNPDKNETLKSIITIEDTSKITEYPAQKDKDILLDIESVALPIQVILSWVGNNIAWNFSVDTFDGTNYASEKAIYSPAGIFETAVSSYTPPTCFNYTYSINSLGKPTIILNIPANCTNKMFFRLRPIIRAAGSSVNIDLEIAGNKMPLQRTLTSTTTTADVGGSGNADNPTVVLETTYLLIAQPLSLFDYVLRTESDVTKN